MFNRRAHRKIRAEEQLRQARESRESAKAARDEQEHKLEQERSIVSRLWQLHEQMVTHNSVTDTLTRIIQQKEDGA